MIIIGIDPGTVSTGYGIIRWDGACYEVVDYGCIKPPPKWKLTDRLLVIHEGVGKLIQEFKPEHLVVETQYVRANPRSAIVLGMARGVILMPAVTHKPRPVSVYEYAPNQAKRAVLGNGKASKHQVQGMVKHLLKLKTEPPEDAADALALAICHAHSLRYQKQLGEEI